MTGQATWTPPEAARLYAAIDATWPAAAYRSVGGWTIRVGNGGGGRVSAATGEGDIGPAQAAMRAAGQAPLFMIRAGQEELDAQLAAAGYALRDPVVFYAISAGELAGRAMRELAGIPCDRPLRIQREIWADGGIGPARLAVMERVKCPRCYLLIRDRDRPVGTAFAATDGDLGMLHALEISGHARRCGAGRMGTIAAARWAAGAGASDFAVLCTRANTAARALYRGLGMVEAGGYHYRVANG